MTARITAEQLHKSHRWFQLDELQQLPGNPNRGDTESLTASVDEFGWIDGIVVHGGVVIAGNHRLQRALDAGETGLPGYDLTAVVPDLSDARRMAMALAHNRTSRLGDDDPELLGKALEILDPDLLAATTYTNLDVLELTTVPLPVAPNANDADGEWHASGMPVHDHAGAQPWKQVTVNFATAEDYESFKKAAGCPSTWQNPRAHWWPHRADEDRMSYGYVDLETETDG